MDDKSEDGSDFECGGSEPGNADDIAPEESIATDLVESKPVDVVPDEPADDSSPYKAYGEVKFNDGDMDCLVCENCGHENRFWAKVRNEVASESKKELGKEPTPLHKVVEAKNQQIMRAMAKLETNVAFFRNRIAKLQDELEQKEAVIQELTLQMKRADVGANEMSFMVQTLQYQLSAMKDRRGRGFNVDLLSQSVVKNTKDSYNLMQAIEVRRMLIRFLHPISAQMHRIKADMSSLRRIVTDKLAHFKRGIQLDGEMLSQLMFQLVAEIEAKPPPMQFPKMAIMQPVRSMPTLRCKEPHLNEASLVLLQGTVGQLGMSISRCVLAAGGQIEIPKVAFSQDLSQQLSNIQATMSVLSSRLDQTVQQLELKLEVAQEEANEMQIQQLEMEHEEMQNQVAICAELMVKATEDPLAKEELTAVLAEVEAKMEAKVLTPALIPKAVKPIMRDKACQCVLMASKDKLPAKPQSSSQPTTQAVFSKGLRQDGHLQGSIQVVPAVTTSSPTTPAPENPFQKTINTIEKVLLSSPHDGPKRQELETLLAEAKKLQEDSRKVPSYKAYVADDRKAIERFQHWRLNQKVRLAKQHFMLEGLFHGLKGYYYEAQQGEVPRSPGSASSLKCQNPAQAPLLLKSASFGCDSFSPQPGSGPYHGLHPSPFKTMTQLLDMPPKVSLNQSNSWSKLQPLPHSSPLSPPRITYMENSDALPSHEDFASSSALRSRSTGNGRRKLGGQYEAPGGPRPTGSAPSLSNLHEPFPESSTMPVILETVGLRRSPTTYSSTASFSSPTTYSARTAFTPKTLSQRVPATIPKLNPIHFSYSLGDGRY